MNEYLLDTDNLKEVEEFEKQFNIIPIYNVLKVYAKEKVRLRKAGTPVAEFDLLIGSTAIAHDMVMVNGNEKHLRKIKNIAIENWTRQKHNSFLE